MNDKIGTDPFNARGQPPDTINTVIILSDNGHHQIDGPHPYVQADGRWETAIEAETDISNHSAFQEVTARNIAENRIGDHALAMADGHSVAWGEILDAQYVEEKAVLRMLMTAAGVPSAEELETGGSA